MDELECVVVGAGVVGLAIARQLALSGRDVLLVEARGTFGEETSSRNSEVIHAGLYYAPGSLKARMCVAGKGALYQFAESHGVTYRRCGKYVVAADQNDMAALERLKLNAEACGVDDLEWLSGQEACAIEPNLSTVGALVSPSTGILDSHGYMLALLGDLEDNGGQVAYRSDAIGGTVHRSGHKLNVRNADGSVSTIGCRVLINSAGLEIGRAHV